MSDLRDDLERAARLVTPPEPAFDRLMRRRERKARNERLAAATLGLTVAGAALGVTLVALGGSARNATPASGARVPAGLEMGPGQYSYAKTVRISPTGEATWEMWWSLDGSGRIEALSEDPNYGVPSSATFGPEEFPEWDDLLELPTDPGVLAEQVRIRSAEAGASPQPAVTPGPGQEPDTGGLWRAVTDLLADPSATPELRAALFHVAAGIVGVERVTDVEDPVGRAAIELRIKTEGYLHELFFDPATLQPMASKEAPIEVEGCSDCRGWYEVVLAAGFASSTSETPPQDQLFFPPPVTDLPEP
jgi:hypothetical protein